jgi:hypothetical protein
MTFSKHSAYISILLSVSLLVPMSTFAMTEVAAPLGIKSSTNSEIQSCLKPLFEKRETAIMAAWDTEYSEIKKAMEARKNGISVALSMTDIKQARKAISTAHKDFRSAVKIAYSMNRENRRLAWEAFKTDTSSCGRKWAISLESSTSNSSTADTKSE